MKDTLKFAGRTLVLLIGSMLLMLIFSGAILGDWIWLNIIMTVALLLAVFYIAFLEGAMKGRRDTMFEAQMRKQWEERGVEPTDDEKQRFYDKKKGFIAAFLAASPWIICSLVICFLPNSGEPNPYAMFTPVLRLLLGMYLGLFNVLEPTFPYTYPVLACLVPLVVSIGYLIGPKYYQQMMGQIEKSKRRRRRRKKKKTQA